MAIGDLYATLSQLKGRLGITDSYSDANLTSSLQFASRAIEKFCGRQFNDSGSVTGRWYRPDTWELTKVDDFSTQDGLTVTVNGYVWTTDRYECLPLNGINSDGMPTAYNAVRSVIGSTFLPLLWTQKANVYITAQWGWSSVPPGVVDACLILAEEDSKLADAPFGIGGYGDYGIVRVRQNPFAARILAPYQRYPFLVA